MQGNRKPPGGEAERFRARFDFKKDGSVLASIEFTADIQPSFFETEEKDAFLTFLAESSHKFYLESAEKINRRL